MLSLKRMDAPFGVEIEAFDVGRPLSAEEQQELLLAFYEHQFMVIPRQVLEMADFDRFCGYFGDPKPHLLDHLRLAGFPNVLTLSNIFENGRPLGIYEGASFWHTDVSYEEKPNVSTVAYAVEVPKQETPLLVASMVMAYDALPESMKRRIEDLQAIHHYGNRDDTDENSPHSAERLTEAQKRQVRNVLQPVVMRHPVTGRKALYSVAGSSFGIEGMPEDEAIDLLDELKRHATQPQFTLSYNYAVQDVAGWDTLSTLHKAPLTRPATGEHDRRFLWRISVTGRPAVFPASLVA